MSYNNNRLYSCLLNYYMISAAVYRKRVRINYMPDFTLAELMALRDHAWLQVELQCSNEDNQAVANLLSELNLKTV